MSRRSEHSSPVEINDLTRVEDAPEKSLLPRATIVRLDNASRLSLISGVNGAVSRSITTTFALS
jgi:hypothetical protein